MISILFLLVSTTIHTSDVSAQAEKYYSNVENDVLVAESIWAITRLYHSTDSVNQNIILESVDNALLKDGLRYHKNEVGTISSLISHYHEEELLLYVLLQEDSKEKRSGLFKEFYNTGNSDRIKEINEFAVNGEIVPEGMLSLNSFTFSYFLIRYYDSTNNIGNDNFFKEYAEHWMSKENPLQIVNLSDELQLFTIFYSLYKEREFQKVDELYDDLISLQHLPYSVLTRNMYWDLEFALYQLGYIDKSLEVQRKFLIPTAKYLGNQDILNRIYASHGGYLYLIGNYPEARKIFNISLESEEAISDSDLTRLYNNLSLVYFQTGESAAYTRTQLLALKHADSYDNYGHILNIYRNLQIFYAKNKNWDLALRYIELAEDLALDVENIQELISIYVSKSEMEFNNNKTAKAFEYINKAESYFNSDTEIRTQVRVLYEKAKMFKKSEQFAESKNILSKIIAEWASELNTPTYLDVVLQLAELEYLTENYTESRRLLKDFRAHDISVVVFPKLVQSKILQAKLSSDEGGFKESEEIYSQTADLVLERARNSADFESGYWMVEQEYLDLFESYADFLLDRNRFPEALTLLDNVKTINDAALLENPLVKSARLTEEELAKERQINQEMDGIRKKLFTASESDRMQLQNDLERLNAQRKELTKNLDIKEPTNIPVWSLQRKLDEHQKLLHIAEINDQYYVSRVTKDNIHIEKREITDDHKSLFEGAIGDMVRGRTDLDALYKVGQFLKLDTIDESVNSIIVMADGYFHQLPIDVIPITKPDSPNSYGSATYAIEKFDIRHVNQLSDLIQAPRSKNTFESDYAGFGISDFQNELTNRDLISLPKAPGEVNAISNHLNRFDNKNSFTGSAASPEAFEAHAGNSRILHMASHSEVSESDPLFSRLHLSPSSSEAIDQARNQLFAYELFDLNLQNDLIMLNSCDSGAGRYLQGSGVMGISRALRYAGAQSLVLNAWSVNDQFAADFAEVFYQHLNNGESKSIALQETKVQFMQNKNANPHYWGPYILNGSNDRLINRESTNNGNWILAFAFLAALVIVSRDQNSFKKAS